MVFGILPDKLPWTAFTVLHIHDCFGVYIYNDWHSFPQTSAWNRKFQAIYSEISKWKDLEDNNSCKFALVRFEGSVGLDLLEYDQEKLVAAMKGIYVWGKGVDHYW